jgi:RNA polymerase sigma-70 factor (ECF subfamily)
MVKTVLSATDEVDTIAAAQRGDLGAFNRLVTAYEGLAYSVAYRTLQNSDSAADAVQDSFVKAYKSIGAFQGGSFKSWIIRIVSNTCYDLLRTRQYRMTDSLDDLPVDVDHAGPLEDPAESPADFAERSELSALIEASIAALPADLRLVLTLCDVHGYSYEEIAEMAQLPMGTVKSRISRARARIRDLLLRQPELLPAAFRPKDGATP